MRTVNRSIDILVGAKIREIREKNKVSKAALANHLSISPQQMYKYEKGINRISVSTLIFACYFLRVAPQEVIGEIMKLHNMIEFI